MKILFPKIAFPLILASIVLFLCFKNYTPDTYLIGWDSIHSEFNFPLNFSRLISHVWGSEMGVGAISAHADMGDLPRITILWLASFVLPASFLRYFYIFLCLILGPLGVYFLLKYVFQREKDSPWIYPAAFLGGLFYLLNLGTLQIFYVPLEMFPTAFAFTPWLFLAGFKYLREGRKSALLSLALVSILAAPMAYAAAQAYAVYAGLFLFLLTFCLISSAKRVKFGRLVILGGVVILLNLYWILPNVYSVVQQSQTISNASINRLFSPEAFLRNADYGNFGNVLIQKSFLFSWRNFDFPANQFNDLLGVWSRHLQNPGVINLGYGLAGLAVLGLVLGFIKKEKVALALVPTLALTLFFLLNINPPLGKLYAYLYDHWSLFSEGFRMPFTKFSVLFELLVSFYFGYFCFICFGSKTIRSGIGAIKVLGGIGICLGLVYFMLPAFTGNLIGSNVRVKFPPEYAQLFGWFRDHPAGRVALMPINSKYGWEYRDWGYEGSGFLTYGIPNPILYRDFDRWHSANEDFYNRAAFALYADDGRGFTDTLKAYQVRYVLVDESLISAGESEEKLRIPEIKNMLMQAGAREVAGFGFLKVYETNFGGSEIGAYVDSGIRDPNRNYTTAVSEDPILVENLAVNRGFTEPYNCDLKKVGTVFKRNSNEEIWYRAENGGVSCDYLGFPDLAYNKGYILRIAGENVSGRSLKIYLFNLKTGFAETEELLPEGNFEEKYLIYPKNLDGGGYLLSLETRSFGRIASENLLTKVEILDATLQGSSFQGVGSETQTRRDANIIQNDLRILDVRKFGSFGYKVETSGSGLLELGQGYEDGWVAWLVFQPNLKSLSQISNLNFLEHQEIDGWANGWLVPSQISRQRRLPYLKSQIWIVYWPQILEWAGMLAGLATILRITLKKAKPTL
jgi:hypothetical protein